MFYSFLISYFKAINSGTNNKLIFVEGLRGFAALIVIFQHLVLMYYPTLYTGNPASAHFYNTEFESTIAISPLNIFYNGNFAVCLFFVLSGFVLSYRYFKSNDLHVLVDYSIKRYFRLLIPVTFSILFVIIILQIFKTDLLLLNEKTMSGPWLTGLFSDQPNVMDVIYNIFIDVFINSNNKYNPVLWTMGVEFLGSLLLFASLFLVHYVKRKSLLLMIITLCLLLSRYYFYAAFLAGALICINYLNPSKAKGSPLLVNSILIVAGIYFASYPTAWQFIEHSIYAPLSVLKIGIMDLSLVTGSVLIILAISRSVSLQKLFSFGVFRFLGKISFSSYLIHLVILVTLSNRLFMYFEPQMKYHYAFMISAVISISVIFILSWIVYKLIDQKAVILSNQISKKILSVLNK